MQLSNHAILLNKRFLLVAGFVIVMLFMGHELELYLPAIEDWIGQLGAFAPLAFIVMFIILSPLFVSVDALCFVSGVLFSLGAGEIYAVLATYIAAAVIFYLGRYLLRDKVHGFIRGHKQLKAVDKLLSKGSFKLMLLLRLTPIPFALLSYALAVTEVSFWPYLGATSGILIYNTSLVYFGYAAKHLAGAISGSSQQSSVSYPWVVLGLMVLLPALFYVAKLAGEAVKRLASEKDGQEADLS